MNLITYAIPLFILSLVIEVLVDRWKGTGYYRLNDALNSLAMGSLDRTFGLFTKIFGVLAYAYFGSHLALFEMESSWFDPSTLSGFLALGAVVLAYDFLYYWKHRAGHEIAYFWAAHAIHHQSEDYNLSTALRQTGTGFFVGWIFYLPLMLIGVPRDVFLTAGALDLIYQFWVHTRHIDRLGWMEKVFVTPSNHRVHHAQNDEYLDKNYGGILIIWDRMFGTFKDEDPNLPVVYGVKTPLRSWNPFWANLHVYAGLVKASMAVERWSDKLRIWYKPPGWRPADFVRQAAPKKEFVKYDPQVPASHKYYVFFQFVGCLIGVPALLLLSSRFDQTTLLLLCLPLWATLYTIGVINEGRRNALMIEAGRLALFFVAALVAFTFFGVSLPLWQTGVLAGYLGVSAIWLALLKAGPAAGERDDTEALAAA